MSRQEQPETFPEAFKALRRQTKGYGLNRREFGELLGLRELSVEKIEEGVRTPPLDITFYGQLSRLPNYGIAGVKRLLAAEGAPERFYLNSREGLDISTSELIQSLAEEQQNPTDFNP